MNALVVSTLAVMAGAGVLVYLGSRALGDSYLHDLSTPESRQRTGERVRRAGPDRRQAGTWDVAYFERRDRLRALQGGKR